MRPPRLRLGEVLLCKLKPPHVYEIRNGFNYSDGQGFWERDVLLRGEVDEMDDVARLEHFLSLRCEVGAFCNHPEQGCYRVGRSTPRALFLAS